jgi:hypothetical protein
MKTELSKIAQDLEKGTITDIEAQNLLLGLFGVINRRELLIDFGKWFNKTDYETVREDRVDEYLKSINCA